jgi:hypothetical protein
MSFDEEDTLLAQAVGQRAHLRIVIIGLKVHPLERALFRALLELGRLIGLEGLVVDVLRLLLLPSAVPLLFFWIRCPLVR